MPIERCVLARDIWPKEMPVKTQRWKEREGIELATSIYRMALNSVGVTPSDALLAVYISGLWHGTMLAERRKDPDATNNG